MKTFNTKCIFISFLFLLINTAHVFAEPYNIDIYSEQWDMPRHGEMLIKQTDLTSLIRLWSNQPNSLIEIRYPGGEHGEIWVQELTDWLVALGIPSEVILHSLGSGDKNKINLRLKNDSQERNIINE